MKKLFTVVALLSIWSVLFAPPLPVPQKMSYQAVIRNSSNVLVANQPVGMRVSILQGSPTGTVVYAETQTPTTNANGLISITIGTGSVISGTFSAIDWSAGPYLIKTEVDPTGGTAYSITATSELLSVPYALHAKTADNITGKPTTLEGFGITDAVTISSDQIITGTKAFNKDITVNGITVGIGANAVNGNTAIGIHTLYLNTTGFNNTATGYSVLNANTKGHSNTANGSNTLFNNTTGNQNTAHGSSALFSNTTGNNNTAVGNNALLLNTTGTINAAFGDGALYSNTTGSKNTGLGFQAGFTNTAGNNNIFIGSTAGFHETGSNKLYIDNLPRANETDARAKALIYGAFDADPANQLLTINGKVGIGTSTPTSMLDVAGEINVNSNKITNVADPVNAQDAATKAYVDAASGIGGSGELNYIPVYTGAKSLGISNIQYSSVWNGCTGISVNPDGMDSRFVVQNREYLGGTVPTYLARFTGRTATIPAIITDYAYIKSNGNAYFKGSVTTGGSEVIGGNLEVNGNISIISSGKVFSDIKEITGITTNQGGFTNIPYPAGYNINNTRILTAEIKEDNKYWISIGMVPFEPQPTMETHDSFYYMLTDDEIILWHPPEVYYYQKPFRLLIMKVQ